MKNLIWKALAGIIVLVIFIINMRIVIEAAGFWGAFIGMFVLPITMIVAPWYALIAWHEWFPLVITYGGGILSIFLFMIGKPRY